MEEKMKVFFGGIVALLILVALMYRYI
jgi:hypothetical protein